MRLFGEQGYRATSVAQIEAAAGLSPGAGGLYHHFPSKQAVLSAGIERHVDRLRALRDIREVFGGLADLRSELTITARYVLTLLEEESQLLRLAVSDRGRQPAALSEAFAEMLASSFGDFADWVSGRAPDVDRDRAAAVAVVALNALLAAGMTRHLLDVRPLDVDDDALVTEWVETVAARIETLSGSS